MWITSKEVSADFYENHKASTEFNVVLPRYRFWYMYLMSEHKNVFWFG